MASTRPPDRRVLELVFNHIALPPRLPDRQDSATERVEQALIERVLGATARLSGALQSSTFEPLRRSLETAKRLHVDKRLNKSLLLPALRDLVVGDFIVIHVSEQNAALIFQRHNSDEHGEEVTIEAFEASPPTEPVLASQGALQWDFPGSAAAVPLSVFHDPQFLEEVTDILEKASTESIKKFGSRAHKSDTSVYESRQTVDPAVVTQLFMTLMSSHGREVNPKMTRKRVRDDVCWSSGGGKPWRRSPMWLILRVAIQRHLCTILGSGPGRVRYKFLMCLVLSQLLDDCPLIDDPTCKEIKSFELAKFLQSKLARRISKLLAEIRNSEEELDFLDVQILLEKQLQTSIESAERRQRAAFELFKAQTQRKGLPISLQGGWLNPHFSLRNSANYLEKVMAQQETRRENVGYHEQFRLPIAYQSQSTDQKPIKVFRKLYFKLALLEKEIEMNMKKLFPFSDLAVSPGQRCQNIANCLEKYLQAVGQAYDFMPEQKSTMILCAMEMWMEMDICALEQFHLMKDFHPGFSTDILDVLHVARQKDMIRLHKVRSYIQSRVTECRECHLTIFANPVNGCFAERYYNESPQRKSLQELHKRIEAHGEILREKTENEWKRATAEFERLKRQEANSSHNNTLDAAGRNTHDRGRCTKCYLQRKIKRSTIKGHEHPLPDEPLQAKVAVFEIGCPAEFIAYRNTTWLILKALGTTKLPKHAHDDCPLEYLPDYMAKIGLERYKYAMSTKFGLASKTKSWLSTHYSTMHLPVSLDELDHPNGLKLEYYDNESKIWQGQREAKPSFAHHCRMVVPANSPLTFLNFSAIFDAAAGGPSSYEVIASQTKCPAGLNVSEYQAFQDLLSGHARRWPQLLVELSSSNINFGTEASKVLINYLALQIGPAGHHDHLGVIHTSFYDPSFCTQLLEQLKTRLSSISCNWREIHSMDALMTMGLRLFELSEDFARHALTFVKQMRRSATEWMINLKTEIHAVTDLEAAQRYSTYLLWAALLCRRTLCLHLEQREHLDASALRCFIESSINLQENMPSDPLMISQDLKTALVRDLKVLSGLQDKIRSSMASHPDIVMSTMSGIFLASPELDSQKFSGFAFLPEPDHWWVQMTIEATSHAQEQVVHFNVMEGTLLVMGKPVGKLPDEWRCSEVVQELFGNESLSTFPSPMDGMTYMLAVKKFGYEIHLGLRHNRVVVRAWSRYSFLEHIPIDVFGTPEKFDLPASLRLGCTHWMNLETGLIEARLKPNIWVSKSNNCYIDFFGRRATKPHPSLSPVASSGFLVDPHSWRFSRIQDIFREFEDPEHLNVWLYTSGTGNINLGVELPRLELTFFLNDRGFLQSPQLRSQIDYDQDAGTWYGLQSKIVLREVYNQYNPEVGYSTSSLLRQRSILVPMGDINNTRSGPHVLITTESNPVYARYMINDVLGRLDCAPEPRLLYLKAALHAYTSLPIPDRLTGRTGTEEAIHILEFGRRQPWTPISPVSFSNLRKIAQLTPRREYYPNSELKVLQIVHWQDSLTASIQYDGYRSIIDDIFQKSQELSSFTPVSVSLSPLIAPGEKHLTNRSELRRLSYHRYVTGGRAVSSAEDNGYNSRAALWTNSSRSNVIECVQTLRSKPSDLATTYDLGGIIQKWSNLEACHVPFNKILLSDILDLDWRTSWGSLLNLCRNSGPENVYRLTFLLATISFGNIADMDVVRVLIAFTLLHDLKALEPPQWETYLEFNEKEMPCAETITQWLSPYRIPYKSDEGCKGGPNLTVKMRQQLQLAETEYLKKQQLDEKLVAAHLLKQWPCEEPNLHNFIAPVSIDVGQALPSIRLQWLRMFKNWQLSVYVAKVQHILNAHRRQPTVIMLSRPSSVDDREFYAVPDRKQVHWTLPELLLVARLPKNSPADSMQAILKSGILKSPKESKQSPTIPLHEDGSEEMTTLETIISRFSESSSATRQEYGKDLARSLAQLKVSKSTHPRYQVHINLEQLMEQIQSAVEESRRSLEEILHILEINSPIQAYWQDKSGIWPPATTCSVLECLRAVSRLAFKDEIRDLLLRYALSITALQRMYRIEAALKKGEEQRLCEEQDNFGHLNWSPRDYPDWILLEIDANLLIRPRQVDVATATVSPRSGSNSVLQLNMGQGKTSCIIPMVAAVLANGTNLMRVVVPKPLLLQTAQPLQARLGGLIGRGLIHIPFSRKTPTTASQIESFCRLHEATRQSWGVMITLPEHLLSFQLSGLQRLSDGRIDEARKMIMTQHLLNQQSRDVIDECDSILALRTQLIYPSGTQKAVDGHPIRWEIPEILLGRVHGHLASLRERYPQSIEVFHRDNCGFPAIFFLRKDAEDDLISKLVHDIFCCRTSIFPPDCSTSDRMAIREFISQPQVTSETSQYVRNIFTDKPSLRQSVYLLRGLLVHRILLMALKKRWNVQYGLHPSRDPIAVPYHAKGTPSDQAEWGHPEVAISLTILAFYYDGLTLTHLRQALEHILKNENDASQAYSYLSQYSSLPDSLREWNSINIEDNAQLEEMLIHLRYNVAVIDYFLNSVVFPRHAKQFQLKIEASAWDLPLSPEAQKSKNAYLPLSTGFSGTNDSKRLLPLTIKQHDLPSLSHTNAEVLTYLLQSRNRRYVQASREGRHVSESELLHMISSFGIRILIDAGAQILEMDNLTLVKTWLEIDGHAKSAVYFDTTGRAVVVYRNNFANPIPLAVSPFADDLGDCLVYLDEAHTRGTDLKLPRCARGALTLGLGQNKDHTVQAAMRLRQLGTTQSVTFFAPPEVHQSILDLTADEPTRSIDSFDVICWLLEQTCRGIEQMEPLFYSQGVDFCRRKQAALDFPNYLSDLKEREAYLGHTRQVEQQTLEELYGVTAKMKQVAFTKFLPRFQEFMQNLRERRKQFHDNGDAVHSSALQEVEQEREVAHQVEVVREVQKPVHYEALKYPGTHRDIIFFAKNGRLETNSEAQELAFDALRRLTVAQKYGMTGDGTSGRLLVSKEFSKTIDVPNGNKALDNFQRPVHWVLWSEKAGIAIIIIPEEAEELLPLLRDLDSPVTYMITYAAPTTRKMVVFNDLGYYAVPRLPPDWKPPVWLRTELGIFSGRLYFDFEEYASILEFLGVEEDAGGIVEWGKNGHRLSRTQIKVFASRPLAFLQDWLALRRRGQDFSETPMGYVCQGKPLHGTHHFFQDRKVSQVPTTHVSAGENEVQVEDKDDGQALFHGIEFPAMRPSTERAAAQKLMFGDFGGESSAESDLEDTF